MSKDNPPPSNIKTNIGSADHAPFKKKRVGPKTPRKITESYLHNAGLYYLQRFASSHANFIEIMLRKVKKSCTHHVDQDFDTCKAMVETLAAKFIDLELLNDDVYTRGKIRALRYKGKSKRFILGHLRTKGIAKTLAIKHLGLHDQELGATDAKAEYDAALTHARKKRLGPYRRDKEENIQKELGSLARAGFSYDISKKILNTDSDEFEEF